MIIYDYRKYCNTCKEYKHITDTVEWTEDTWIPEGCNGHKLTEAVLGEIEELKEIKDIIRRLDDFKVS